MFGRAPGKLGTRGTLIGVPRTAPRHHSVSWNMQRCSAASARRACWSRRRRCWTAIGSDGDRDEGAWLCLAPRAPPRLAIGSALPSHCEGRIASWSTRGLPTGEVGIEDLISERDYLRKAHEIHATALARAGVKSIAPQGSGTLVAPRRAGVCGSRSEIRPASRLQAHSQGVAGTAQNAVPVRHRARNGGQSRALVRLYQRSIFCVRAQSPRCSR
jgi:hypothetical protein